MVYEGSPEFIELESVSLGAFRKTYGRNLLPGEIGCSLSHNRARFLSAQSPIGAIIIEEDAIVLDLDLFVRTAIDFLTSHTNKVGVLSFYNNEYQFSRNEQPYFPRKWIRSIGAPSSTVAYAITCKSAQILLERNTPIKFLADWPVSHTYFYIAAMNVISHTDEPGSSQIGPRATRQNGFNLLNRVKILTFKYYFENSGMFENFPEFLHLLWLPRFKYQLNRLMFGFYFRIGVLL